MLACCTLERTSVHDPAVEVLADLRCRWKGQDKGQIKLEGYNKADQVLKVETIFMKWISLGPKVTFPAVHITHHTCLIVMCDSGRETDAGAPPPSGADRMGRNVHHRTQHLGFGNTGIADLEVWGAESGKATWCDQSDPQSA